MGMATKPPYYAPHRKPFPGPFPPRKLKMYSRVEFERMLREKYRLLDAAQPPTYGVELTHNRRVVIAYNSFEGGFISWLLHKNWDRPAEIIAVNGASLADICSRTARIMADRGWLVKV